MFVSVFKFASTEIEQHSQPPHQTRSAGSKCTKYAALPQVPLAGFEAALSGEGKRDE